MGVRRYALQPHAKTKVLGISEVTNSAINDDPKATTPLEIGQHHVAKYAARNLAASVYDDNVAHLGVVEGMPMNLRIGRAVLAFLGKLILPLGEVLERDGGPNDALAGHEGG